jgi:hypothetical protein
MSNITEKVIEQASDMLGNILKTYRQKIDVAYLKDDPLTVNLAVKFEASRETVGDVDLTVSINFVTDRIKTSFERTVTETQDELFPKEKKEDVKVPEPEGRSEMRALKPAVAALTSGHASVIDAEIVSEVNEFGEGGGSILDTKASRSLGS